MVEREWTLATGETGFVGRHVFRELVERGQQVVALVRPTGSESAVQRMNSLRQGLTPEQSARTLVIAGDITTPQVIAADNPTRLRYLREYLRGRVGRVVHCAADVSFAADADPRRTNVDGVINLLALMDGLGIKELHHVSTAYVCGCRPGAVVKETDSFCAADCRNAYEFSKRSGEFIARTGGLESVTVYRPSIVVGESGSGAASCFKSFYYLVRFAQAMQAGVLTKFLDGVAALRIPLSGNEPVNLVPVDYVARVIGHVVTNPEHHGRTYHVTPTTPFTTGQVGAAIGDYFGFDGIRFVGAGEVPSRIVSELPKWLAEYHDYFGTDPRFDTTNTDAAMGGPYTLDGEEFLRKIIDFAVGTNFGRVRE